MGKKIDLTRMSYHLTVERADRVRHIENSIGWGTEVISAPCKDIPHVERVLTTTGVMIVRKDDGLLITAWIADVKQAVSVWKTAKGDRPLPHWLWNMVNYNNNTTYWQNLVAA
jgi:hypothetical protein